VATTRRNFIDVVESRFPGVCHRKLRAEVERQTDNTKLSHWIVVAATATDLTQLKASIFGEAIEPSRA